jgi:hypothetical protein
MSTPYPEKASFTSALQPGAPLRISDLTLQSSLMEMLGSSFDASCTAVTVKTATRADELGTSRLWEPTV